MPDARSALPDEFNRRLESVGPKLKRLFKKEEWKAVTWVLVSTNSTELPESVAYPLLVWLTVRSNPLRERDFKIKIEEIAERLGDILNRCEEIELEDINVLGEDEVTLDDMRRFEVLDLDHRSLAQDPPGDLGDLTVA